MRLESTLRTKDLKVNTVVITVWQPIIKTGIAINPDGTKRYLESVVGKQQIDISVDVYFNKLIGCYYKYKGMFNARDVSDVSLSFIEKQYKNNDFKKWDKFLN